MQRHTRIFRGALAASAITAFLVGAPSVVASEPPGDLAGYEMRGNLPGTEVLREDHVWFFRAGGQLAGNYSAILMRGQGAPTYLSDSDTGTWRRNGEQICVTFRKFYRGRELCFTVTATGDGWYQFQSTTGGGSFRATLKR